LVVLAVYLTKNELQIMRVLWRAERSLTMLEIVDAAPEINAPSFYFFAKSLVKKNALTTDGFVQRARARAKTYKPLISEADYLVSQASGALNPNAKPENFKHALTFLSHDERATTKEDLDELQKYIDQLRKELEESGGD